MVTKPHLNPNLNLAEDGVRRAVVRVAAKSNPGERHSPTRLCADHGLADAARRPVPCEEESHEVSLEFVPSANNDSSDSVFLQQQQQRLPPAVAATSSSNSSGGSGSGFFPSLPVYLSLSPPPSSLLPLLHSPQHSTATSLLSLLLLPHSLYPSYVHCSLFPLPLHLPVHRCFLALSPLPSFSFTAALIQSLPSFPPLFPVHHCHVFAVCQFETRIAACLAVSLCCLSMFVRTAAACCSESVVKCRL
uniref:Uncharacterized protein n=1 Tax=Musa acuminata subsp. malaccensis TaxID=214687 RepID=A0A804HZJ4_MUSAM